MNAGADSMIEFGWLLVEGKARAQKASSFSDQPSKINHRRFP
jgi:hypothetical protein